MPSLWRYKLETYRRRTFESKDLVVLSMDLICTLALGVIGELICFKGLKLRMAEMILLDMLERVRIVIPKQFRVALTMIGSLAVYDQILLFSSTIM